MHAQDGSLLHMGEPRPYTDEGMVSRRVLLGYFKWEGMTNKFEMSLPYLCEAAERLRQSINAYIINK